VYESVSGNDNGALSGRVITLLKNGRAGLVTDIDGTISPIVARPEEAMVLPEARTALEGLSDRLALVGVVTGRSVEDARRMVGIDRLTYVGNHGMEVLNNGRAELAAEAKPWVPRLAVLLNNLEQRLDPSIRTGVIVENKGVTASLHYRLTPDPDAARTRLLEILAETPDFRVEEGRRVINLLPPLNISKGSAVTWIVREHQLDSIVFFGDDVTDVHAFEALDTLRQGNRLSALNIGVVGPETPESVRQRADARLPSVNAVADLLHAVLVGLGGAETSGTMAVRTISKGSPGSVGST
jgi:trehalose 6-phosphate phosphatase